MQPGPAVPKAAVKQTKGRQVMKVRTPGGRGGAEAQKTSPAQAKPLGSASDQMAAAMKLLSESVSQAMMGGVTAGQTQGVRNKANQMTSLFPYRWLTYVNVRNKANQMTSLVLYRWLTYVNNCSFLGSGRHQDACWRGNYQSYNEQWRWETKPDSSD